MMAAIEESGYYLPPPEQCFGEQQLLLYENLRVLKPMNLTFTDHGVELMKHFAKPSRTS